MAGVIVGTVILTLTVIAVCRTQRGKQNQASDVTDSSGGNNSEGSDLMSDGNIQTAGSEDRTQRLRDSGRLEND